MDWEFVLPILHINGYQFLSIGCELRSVIGPTESGIASLVTVETDSGSSLKRLKGSDVDTTDFGVLCGVHRQVERPCRRSGLSRIFGVAALSLLRVLGTTMSITRLVNG